MIPDPAQIAALLFDLGGVVIDIDFGRVFDRWAAHAGCDSAAIKAAFRMDHHYERHERGEIDAAAYFASLRSSLGIDLPDVHFHDGWRDIFVGERAGMAALLQRAGATLPLYLFSNSNAAHHQVWSRQYAGILGVFRRVFVSSDIGKRKPDPSAFRAVAVEIGVPASRILFFDDARENVEGARASGMQAVHVKSIADVEDSLKVIIEPPLNADNTRPRAPPKRRGRLK